MPARLWMFFLQVVTWPKQWVALASNPEIWPSPDDENRHYDHYGVQTLVVLAVILAGMLGTLLAGMPGVTFFMCAVMYLIEGLVFYWVIRRDKFKQMVGYA